MRIRIAWLAIRSVVAVSAVTLATVIALHTPADDPSPETIASAEFSPTTVWSTHLEIAAREFDPMQSAAPAFPGGPPVNKTDDKKRVSKRNMFGTEFPWAEAEVTANGNTHEPLALT